MGLYQNTPVFLDYNSGFTPEQVDTINVIVRQTRNRMITIAKQEQEEQPRVSKIVSAKYNRVLDLKDYKYGKHFSISFILNPASFEKGINYPLFEVNDKIISVFDYQNQQNVLCFVQGSNDPDRPYKSLSSLGYCYIDYSSVNPTIYFHLSEDWPASQGRKIYYSVFISGDLE